VEQIDVKGEKTREEMQVMMCRAESLETEVGKRITPVNAKLSILTIWGSVAMLAGFMDDAQKVMENLQNDGNLKLDMKKEIKNIEATALASVQSMF
jgi:hypothetical protein